VLRICLIIMLGWCSMPASVAVASESGIDQTLPTIVEKTNGFEKYEGFFTYF